VLARTRDDDLDALAEAEVVIGIGRGIPPDQYDALEPLQWPRPAGSGDVAAALSSGERAASGSVAAETAAASKAMAPPRPFADGRFFTRSGKAQLVATPPRAPAHRPNAEFPLVLNTGRIRDQWHTMTRTGRSPRLMGRNPEPFVQVHPLDAARFGVAMGDLVELSSATGRIVVRLEIDDAVAPGQVFAPMHWSERLASLARVGAAIAAAVDPVSGQPELKHMPVSLRRYEPAWHAFVLSREPLAVAGCSYRASARGQGYWRYELAGEELPKSWSAWADRLLGPRHERLELTDSAGRYRGARVVGDRLGACVFVATTKALPSRTWLAGLFAEEALTQAARVAMLSGRAAKPGSDAGPIVCSCFAVGRSTLLRAIRTQALVSADAIGEALRAGTNCGSCVPELKALLLEAAGGAEAVGADS